MKLRFLVLSLLGCLTLNLQAQETQNETSVQTASVIQSEKELKQLEKEARQANKTLKKQNQWEETILDLEKNLAKDGKILKKLQDKHSGSKAEMTDVKREKLELKMAKLEMKMAKDREKLKKYRKKLR